ncbi:hypothetical protein [Zavarzinella formosa]|uniref:hypothetical protein n=1 Tax=Zavarzinella formosa TaxID=360055 RepID=UPI000372F7DE|nr:hypothetical protein [Zavarzinella formosa]
MEQDIKSVAVSFLAERNIPFAEIEDITLLNARQSEIWYDLFQNQRQRKGLWKVLFIKRILIEYEVDTANHFCVLVDPETLECALYV